MHMPDSPLNGAERVLQQSFRKLFTFNGLLVGAAVLAAYWSIRELPDRRERPQAIVPLQYEPVSLSELTGPLRLAGAWVVRAQDPRFHGLSGLAIDRGQFLAVTDLGGVIRFDRPTAKHPSAMIQDLSVGPGDFAKKWARDAESLARDPYGRGWWVGFEQNHSLWLYDDRFRRALTSTALNRPDWWNNRGAEGLLAEVSGLLVLAENGREAMPVRGKRIGRIKLDARADVADAALAPDGSAWLLLRSKGLHGISQSIARLTRTIDGYRARPTWPVPKGLFDNYEGMAVERLPAGDLRFWLVTDDGHRIMARTLLVALDYAPPPRHVKSPAQRTGLSKQPSGKMP
jgi:hypothetical protein